MQSLITGINKAKSNLPSYGSNRGESESKLSTSSFDNLYTTLNFLSVHDPKQWLN